LYIYGAKWSPGRAPGTGDPAAGRFIQADSIVPIPSTNQEDIRQIMLSLIVDYHETNLLSQLNTMYRENISKSTDTTQELTYREDELSPQLNYNNILEKEQNNSNSADLNNYGLVDFNEMKDNGKIQATEHQANRTQRSIEQTLVDMNPSRLNSMSLDRFAYTSNCPTKFTDPTGHKECNIGELITGGLTVVGSEIPAILAGGVTLYPTMDPNIAFQAFEAVNMKTNPLFLVGFGLMIHSGSVKMGT
jgi:hypothetical protein